MGKFNFEAYGKSFLWDTVTFLNDNGGCAVAVIACGPRGKGKKVENFTRLFQN